MPKTNEDRIDSLESQVRKLFNLCRDISDKLDAPVNNVMNDVDLATANAWYESHVRVYPPRISQYGSRYYKERDIPQILAAYLVSQRS
jgi:hypothetical protein